MSIKQILASAINPEANSNATLELVSLEDMDMMSDLHNVELEIMESETAISVTETAIVGLEGIHGTASVYQENGGLDFQSASLLNASIEAIMLPFGGNTLSMPAQEAYEGDGGRVAATTYAMEGLASVIKTMWAAIVALFKKAKDAIVKWFKGNASRLEKVKKAADDLSKLASKSKGKPKAGKLKISSPELMYTDGKFVGGDPKVITLIGIVTSDYTASTDDERGLEDLIYDSKITDIQSGNDFNAELDTYIQSIVNITLKDTVVKDKRIPGSDGKGYMYSDVFPGNAFLVKAMNGYELPTLYFISPVKDKKLEGSEEPGLDKNGIAELCGMISEISEKLTTMSKGITNLDDSRKDLMKAGDSIVKQASDLDTPQIQKTAKRAMSVIKTLSNNTTIPYYSLAKYATRLIYASYSYAKLSYANLEEAK